jgi:Arc/MetJ-type ribon-helix-helix transcriptional regulator
MTVSLLVSVPDSTAQAIDGLVDAGVYRSRSDAVRVGLAMIVDRDRGRATGRAIAERYRRPPPEIDALGRSDAASSAMIAEEPW